MNKKSKSPKTSAPHRAASPRNVRRELTRLNREIIRLCHERAELIRSADDPAQVAQWLQTSGAHEELRRPQDPLTSEHLRAVFRELDSATRSLIGVERVAYLGPEFSYSHLAAIEQFGQSSELIPVSSIAGVFESVERGDAKYGVVPIENSTDGRIVDTLDRFAQSHVQIRGELPLPIHHNLLGIGTLAEVREVHSKPQALSQCRHWLARHLPEARQVAASSSTAAAQAAAADPHIAAIASKQAGVNYGLSILGANIEDNPDNVTRFAILGLDPAERTGRDKTSLMFELAHQPGALAEAMAIFKRNRLNLTWIESFPKKGSQNEYLFFVELEGHLADAAVRRAIRSLKAKTVRTEILGSYARGQISAPK
jgi:chorismate mutase / prephenate dehydratase